MAIFSGTDIIVAGAMAIAAVGGIIAAWRQGLKTASSEHNQDYDHAPRGRVLVTLAEEDRILVRATADRLIAALKDHAEVVGKHRYAIGDQTAEIRRRPSS